MQARERTHTGPFLALELSIAAIECLRPTVISIRRCDRDLGEQLRRALTSISLNLVEGKGEKILDRLAGMLHGLGAER